MTGTPWIKFYASDWLAGTSGLTAAERGVYITIVCLIYEYGGPVPLDKRRMARRCGVPAGSFAKILDALISDEKLVIVDGGVTNRRAEIEIEERQKLRTKHQSGARKANAIQAEKSQQKQQNQQRTADRTAHAYQKPEPDIREEPKGSLSSGDDAATTHFDEIAEAVSAYNAAASESGWPTVRILSKARRSALAARLRECGGLAGWETALAKARASPLCCGQNDRGWVANFDFLTRQSSFTKLMEGNYDRRTGDTGRPPHAAGHGRGASLASIAARRRAASGG